MSAKEIEQRLAALENDVRFIKDQYEKAGTPWWQEWSGAFLNDPHYAQVMKHIEAYRESLKPKAKKRRKPSHGSS